MNFLAEIKTASQTALKTVSTTDKNDRSNPNVALGGKDVLDDEAERWEYFFNSGVSAWFDDIQDVTFTSTFCSLTPEEAQCIVNHWDERRVMVAAFAAQGVTSSEPEFTTAVQTLYNNTTLQLQDLVQRLNVAIATEIAISPVQMAFVKLSTRSPKDSKKALARAELEYSRRVQELGGVEQVSTNDRWRILCEETTQSGAVNNGADALELLLDSDRVYEDLEYALRGPPESWVASASTATTATSATTATTATTATSTLGKEKILKWNMSLVARAWDPRLKPQSEFRGICWDGKLTCLCQYFHPLFFPELIANKTQIEQDIMATFHTEKIMNAINRLGGHCMIDFAWLGPGEVIIVELNPFDGVCLGTFPASTGLFLWDKPEDQQIMKGETSFEFRLRETELAPHQLKAQCNPTWRDIMYSIGDDAGKK